MTFVRLCPTPDNWLEQVERAIILFTVYHYRPPSHATIQVDCGPRCFYVVHYLPQRGMHLALYGNLTPCPPTYLNTRDPTQPAFTRFWVTLMEDK